MFCNRCGKPIQANATFCPACGTPVRNIPLMPTQSRLAGHIRLLGIFWIALSAFRILPGLVLMAVFNRPDFPPGVPDFVHGIVLGIAGTLMLLGFAGIAVGIGLLNRAPWARMMAIIFGCVSLIDMPFGTALGVYTLWVLLPAQSEDEYRQMARTA